MRADMKPGLAGHDSSFFSLLSGWVNQGIDNFFATQRILLDLAMRQNASVMNVLRDRLADPHHSPATIVTELTGEGMSNFIEAQKVLLGLAQKQNDILLTGVKQRVGDSAAALATVDVLRHSVDTFVDMQQEFLKIASKQTENWLAVAKTGKPQKGDGLIGAAREGMENFVRAQKRFLDMIAEETEKLAGKRGEKPRMLKKTELTELARQATDAFLEAQKKLFDLAGRQMNMNVKAAGKTMEMIKPFPLVPLADLTREGVKSFVEAQKALMDVMMKRREVTAHKPERKPKRAARTKEEKAQAAHAAA
jgi:hypothetical protein